LCVAPCALEVADGLALFDVALLLDDVFVTDVLLVALIVELLVALFVVLALEVGLAFTGTLQPLLKVACPVVFQFSENV
jgi:hypothetical protein